MTRFELARAEIARRRALAEAASDGPWFAAVQRGKIPVVGSAARGKAVTCGVPGALGSADARHIAANDPAHVLAVLATADATLDRHARTHRCQPRWLDDDQASSETPGCYVWPHLLCADAAAVLDLYAPEATCSCWHALAGTTVPMVPVPDWLAQRG